MNHMPTLYDVNVIPSYEDNPYRQDLQVCGTPSVMPAHVWRKPDPHFSLPIPAEGMHQLQRDDLNAYFAPWVPHSSPVDGSTQRPVWVARNSDIPYLRLKAPKF